MILSARKMTALGTPKPAARVHHEGALLTLSCFSSCFPCYILDELCELLAGLRETRLIFEHDALDSGAIRVLPSSILNS